MNTPLLVLLSASACCLLVASPASKGHAGEQRGKSVHDQWRQLNEELESLQKADDSDVLSSEGMRRGEFYTRIAKNGQAKDFIAMIEQDDYSLVKLAGFYALKDRFPERTFEGALRLFVTAGRPTYLVYAPAVQSLREVSNDPEHRTALRVLEEAPKTRSLNVGLLASRLPYKMLFDWFHETQGMLKEPTRVLVLARLYDEGHRRQLAPTPLMAKYLARCAEYPGKPRLVYLYYADPKEEDYVKRLREYLSDESESNAALKRIVALRRNLIMKSVDIEGLKVSLERRSAIRDALSIERAK